MNVLVTGATGVVGSRVVPILIAGGHRVRAIGRSAERLAALEQESFAPAYPDRGDQWIGEETPMEPAGYNRTIADAEASAARFTQTSGGAGIVLRFGAFMGPTRVSCAT